MLLEALMFGALSLGDEITTARFMATKEKLEAMGYTVKGGEHGLATHYRYTFHVTFTIGGGYGVSKLEGKKKWIILGVATLAKSWVIYHNWQEERGLHRFLVNARSIRPAVPGSQ